MAKATLILEHGGVVVDTAIAEMPDAAFELAVDAIAAAYGYQAEIEDPDNPGQMIPNPMTKWRHYAYQLRAFATDHARTYAMKRAAEAATAQAAAQIDALAGQVAVDNEGA